MTQWFKHPEQPNTWISRDEYFAILFGDEYMASEDKLSTTRSASGTVKEY